MHGSSGEGGQKGFSKLTEVKRAPYPASREGFSLLLLFATCAAIVFPILLCWFPSHSRAGGLALRFHLHASHADQSFNAHVLTSSATSNAPKYKCCHPRVAWWLETSANNPFMHGCMMALIPCKRQPMQEPQLSSHLARHCPSLTILQGSGHLLLSIGHWAASPVAKGSTPMCH